MWTWKNEVRFERWERPYSCVRGASATSPLGSVSHLLCSSLSRVWLFVTLWTYLGVSTESSLYPISRVSANPFGSTERIRDRTLSHLTSCVASRLVQVTIIYHRFSCCSVVKLCLTLCDPWTAADPSICSQPSEVDDRSVYMLRQVMLRQLRPPWWLSFHGVNAEVLVWPPKTLSALTLSPIPPPHLDVPAPASPGHPSLPPVCSQWP